MEQDLSQAATGTYADEIGFSNTPEDYNDSTFVTAPSGPSNIIGSENITTTYPGTNITDTSNIYTGDDAYPLYGGAQTYNIIRGGTATNPYPESFFSKLFGAENVDYTNILGRQGVADLINLRYRQATNQPSLKTGRAYQPRDFVIGAPTVMGEVKPMDTGVGSFFRNIFPGLSSIVSPPGLPEGDRRYQEFLKDQEAGGTTERAGTTDANVSGFNLSDVINSIKAGITNLFDYPKPVQDAVSNTMTESAFITPPSMSEDFGVTRTEPGPPSMIPQRSDMMGIASVLPEENRRDMEDNIGFTPFGDEIKLIDRSPSPVKKEVISQNQNQGIGGINEIFKKDLDNLMRSGLSRDAARAIIMDKYNF